MSSAASATSADWSDFMKSMSTREVAKSWSHAPNPETTAQRRRSVVDRIQKELEQEAQFEQVVRDPGVVRGDLLARAANAVVGQPEAGAGESDPALHNSVPNGLPTNLRPGSVIVPAHSEGVKESAGALSIHPSESINPSALELQQSQTATASSGDAEEKTNAATMDQGTAHRADIQGGPANDHEPSNLREPVSDLSATSSSENADESETESDSSEEPTRPQLDVVAEEEEDSSSSGHHEMRAAPRTSYAHRSPPARYSALASALKNNQARDTLTAAPEDRVNEGSVRIDGPEPSVHVSPASPPPSAIMLGKALNADDSPPVPPKDLRPALTLQPISDQLADAPSSAPNSAYTSADEHQAVLPDGHSAGQDSGVKDDSSDSSSDEGVDNEANGEAARSTSSSGSSEEFASDGTDEESGKDGEEGPRTQVPPLAAHQRPPDLSTQAATRVSDSSSTPVKDAEPEQSKDSSEGDSGDDTETRTVGSASTGRQSARGSVYSSKAPTLQRRLSDLSLGTSFAFSHFMGSRVSGRSSSRRIKLRTGDDDSDDDGEASEEDEELKKRALAEQERLRNMSVGDDFFGGSLSDVLAKFNQLSADQASVNKTTLLAEAAHDAGVGTKVTEQAQRDAMDIVSEVRKLRASGDKDIDRKTLQSESGGTLAASFAALWLMEQEQRDQDAAPQATPTQNEASEQKDGVSAPKSARPSVLDRPRFRRRKPVEMAGIPISQGRLSAETPRVKEDERSTLPSLNSLSSFASRASTNPPEKPARASIDLGDQKRSRDKPAPAKSALKSRSLKHSKSLADTLFNFAPKTNEESADKSTKKKRVRALSFGSKASSRGSTVTSDKAGRRSEETGPQPDDVRTESSHTPNQDLNALHVPIHNESRSSSASVTPVKEAGDPVALSRDSTPVDLLSVAPSATQAQAKPSKGKAKASKQSPESPKQAAESVQSSTLPGLVPVSPPRKSSVTAATGAAFSLSADNIKAPPQDQPSSPSSELWSDRSGVSTNITAPSLGDAVGDAKGLSQRMKDDESERDKSKTISLPPVPTFGNAGDGPPQVSNEDRTPLARMKEESALGINVIPPTPPALSESAGAASMKRSASSSSRTPTLEKPAIFGSESSSAPALKRSNSSTSKKSDGNASKRGSKQRNSMLQDAEAHGLSLPPGMTATTIASSSSTKRKKSTKKSSTHSASNTSKRASVIGELPVPALPRSGSSAETLGAQMPLKEQAPLPPPKELAVPSRVYAASALPDHLVNGSLASSSPPASSAASSVGYPDGDVSPARSVTSRASSSNLSSSGRGPYRSSPEASAASNSAASLDVSSGRGLGAPRAKVRTQSLGPATTRRGSTMAAIDEWASSSPLTERTNSPLPGVESAYSLGGRDPSSRPYSPSVALSTISVRSEEPSIYGRSPSQVDSHLHIPVARSRMTMDDRLREQFDAQYASSSPTAAYSQSLDGHGNNFGGLQRAGSVTSVARSVDGHSASVTRQRYPASMASGMSSISDVQSLASLPTVPQSSYRPRDAVKAAGSSAVDERLFQRSTMATISVSSGAFKKEAKSALKRSSMDVMRPSHHSGAARSSMDQVPEHLQDELGLTTMTLTAHTPPPRKIGAGQVLVQNIAVAIDEIDRMLLREKVRSDSAYGWVPGRSFCGRVMEAGWEVKRLRKGDVIFGLQSNRKCGALAEFMTIDQQLVAKAPEDCLTVEQIAALPSAGVLAYQVMRNHCANLPSGARILILNAHDGIGLLALQECAALGPVIVAHCPATVSDGVAVCEANGAQEVVVGEALWAMNTLHESSFDLVLDTIGGRRLYDAARRILATNGQFVTCFGDEHNSANPNFRSQMRSIRRSFFKKDKKNIGYEWISVDSSEDCKEALEAVKAVAENGDICPRLRSVLPFAEAPRAFDPVLRGSEEEPGAVVVRIS